ncbi:type VII secretion protein EssA [Bacillus sp. RO2]|uniref:type VII secretion protein EssA n=1 Tax=Bacillus sp. RO2 TaxID=2723913 RepID=UPI00145E1946|nr:type VII secretion protein EssA [Bacillus sp. RO2]NMH73171.1 type VII secretion protein EssA [Bacillus sp. RO2]
MKAKVALLLISICVLTALLPLNGIVTMAESDIESLEPNSYEKKDFKENTDFLRENNLNERRESVPEEQKLLTFKKRKKKEEEDFVGTLFMTGEKKSTTIQATSQEWKLFTQEDNSRYQTAVASDSSSKTNSITILLYGFLAIALILMLAIILPRMAKGKA